MQYTPGKNTSDMLQTLAKFRPGWKISLFTLLLLPLMIWLGFWQLEREDEKLALQATYQQREAAEPVSLARLDWQGDLQYMPVSLQGYYDNQHTFLLDNRVHQGRVGFEVVSPFVTDSGHHVLVNRGWLPMGRTRADLPDIEAVPGNVQLQGKVYVPLGEPFTLGEQAQQSGWPRIIQSLDPQAQFAELDLPPSASTFPYSIRLAEQAPGVLVRSWPLISTQPEKHRAYAVQWFAMALALLALFIYVGLHRDQ